MSFVHGDNFASGFASAFDMPNGTTELGLQARGEIVLGLSGEFKAMAYIVDGNRFFDQIFSRTKEDFRSVTLHGVMLLLSRR